MSLQPTQHIHAQPTNVQDPVAMKWFWTDASDSADTGLEDEYYITELWYTNVIRKKFKLTICVIELLEICKPQPEV